MEKPKRFPYLYINREKIYENAKRVVEICGEKGIGVSGVIKGVNGIHAVSEEFLRAGCAQIASSRIGQLKDFKKRRPDIETMLLRVPMESEIEAVILHSDISLNSERETIELMEKKAEEFKVNHKVILMMDLGDLREGFFEQEKLIELALHIEKNMKYVKLGGVGTNLGCYGSVKPTIKNLGELCSIAAIIEEKIGRKLEFISGGATSSLPLLVSGEMPEGINNLRIGEGILLNMDLPELWEVDIAGMHKDTFILHAQIVEIKEKPSHPVGELFIDAYGNKPTYEDRGTRKRALLAIGKQDFAIHEKLVPMDEGIEIIGSSSDHTIVDIQDGKKEYKIGDVMKFRVFYGPMLHLCTSEWVEKVF